MAGEERFYYFVGIFPDIFSVRMVFFSKTFSGIAEKKITKKSQTYFSFCRYDAGQDLSNRELKEKSSLQRENHFSLAKKALN